MKRVFKAALVICFVLVGCKKEEGAKAEAELSTKEKKTKSKRIEDRTKSGEQDVVRSVASTFDKIEASGGIISSSKIALQDFEHPFFFEEVGAESFKSLLGESVSLSESLKDKSSQWNSDPSLRKAVIGTASLLTGLIGVPEQETVSGLPELFLHEKHKTQRDVLLLQVARQSVVLAERKIAVENRDFTKWLEMAQSPNEVTRYTALVLFELVEPTREQANEFFGAYVDKGNQSIVDYVELKSKNCSALE